MEKEKQFLLNAIATLSGTFDAFSRAGDLVSADLVAKKLQELIKDL
jgi:hypothetical protein